MNITYDKIISKNINPGCIKNIEKSAIPCIKVVVKTENIKAIIL